MSYNSFLNKPENALRRAEELLTISQPSAALALLHEILSSRRHKTWSPTYEKIIILYLDLCLQLGRSREAKDGLHQYRNLSQSQAPGSLEAVIRHLIEASEKKCREAKEAADKGESPKPEEKGEGEEATADDDDADFYEGSHLLLSTMSTDPEKAQRDTAVLLPALKFLWEVYRAVLDILKSNSKLERLYHGAAVAALRFCGEYKRRVEFRRLCDMMRMHLGNLSKFGGVGTVTFDAGRNNKVRGWEGWTADSIELHLQTRFAQLETASTLRLYTEGFRTVEDIYNILQISRTRRKLPGVNIPPPKAKIMAAYYEKLTNLFWVSENYLFHAFAWYKYYSLCKEYNRGMSDEMKTTQASAVLLATLCIPTTTSDNNKGTSKSLGRDAIQSTVEDDIAKEKMARMATLLGFHTREPSRDALLAEIRSRNIIEDVPDYLRDLYVILEDSTDPLDMVEKARPLLDTLRAESAASLSDEDAEDNTLGRYVEPLTNMLILKLIFNLSAAYHTISLDHVKKLTSGLGVSFEQMENSIILSAQSRALSVRIDHRAGCIRFGSAALESDEMRGQLSILAKRLTTACNIISPPEVSSVAAERTALYAEVRSSIESEHINTLERKVVIEKRKEESERLVQERLRAEEAARKAEELARKAEEDRRLAREQKLREKEKLQKIQDEMEAMEKKRYLTAMGRNAENMTVEQLKEVDTAALAKEHADKANKKKEEAERKVKEAARQLDYLVRAVRIEELPRIKEAYDTKIKEDRTQFEQDVVDKATRAKNQWEKDIKEKASLRDCSVFNYTSEFQSTIMAARTGVHEKLCKEEDELAELEAEKGKLTRARKRKADEARLAEEAKIAAEKAEADRKAEEERQRKEEERRQRQEELEKKERIRMEEQREREQRERSERSQPAPAAGGETRSKYVPPSRRGGGGNRWGGGGSGGGSSSDRGGGYGGGRYEGRDGGRDGGGSRPAPTNSRWS
mmetsp:Transcript_21797/g.43659  ORF Transcript_21797/g.43659 Transcript_21797/m.43659 type:complete len:972 (+) Transcript_21797:39-2954(+)|eukprot:CAMPEP_0113399394 /NCGR_PEP_ID=MMETSP0013_2-20120614/15514_1 /TAXON_ID=2843 ORGANISM="Skeletonema costatum, Strain 1716" /NCGR_SAMPLE_ID=MMETSP0013_2 /ASSEMBLY_ACC=CAM_ASM_000158 /LENGTH=971 /DNA_ID=CAMNT_0000284289 /DNA_START=40 /DNA_END=2955 /DNA_ORIENTATION=- /assembly_acc=CAM_ASM_000158